MSDAWKIAAFYHFTDLPDRDAWAERVVARDDIEENFDTAYLPLFTLIE